MDFILEMTMYSWWSWSLKTKRLHLRRLWVCMRQTWGLLADWRSTLAPACEPPHALLFQPTPFCILITTLLRQKNIKLTKSGPCVCIVIQCPTLHELCPAQRQTFAEGGFKKERKIVFYLFWSFTLDSPSNWLIQHLSKTWRASKPLKDYVI